MELFYILSGLSRITSPLALWGLMEVGENLANKSACVELAYKIPPPLLVLSREREVWFINHIGYPKKN